MALILVMFLVIHLINYSLKNNWIVEGTNDGAVFIYVGTSGAHHCIRLFDVKMAPFPRNVVPGARA